MMQDNWMGNWGSYMGGSVGLLTIVVVVLIIVAIVAFMRNK